MIPILESHVKIYGSDHNIFLLEKSHVQTVGNGKFGQTLNAYWGSSFDLLNIFAVTEGMLDAYSE